MLQWHTADCLFFSAGKVGKSRAQWQVEVSRGKSRQDEAKQNARLRRSGGLGSPQPCRQPSVDSNVSRRQLAQSVHDSHVWISNRWSSKILCLYVLLTCTLPTWATLGAVLVGLGGDGGRQTYVKNHVFCILVASPPPEPTEGASCGSWGGALQLIPLKQIRHSCNCSHKTHEGAFAGNYHFEIIGRSTRKQPG